MNIKSKKMSKIGVLLLAAFCSFMLAIGTMEFIMGWPFWRSIISITLGIIGVIIAIKIVSD